MAEQLDRVEEGMAEQWGRALSEESYEGVKDDLLVVGLLACMRRGLGHFCWITGFG